MRVDDDRVAGRERLERPRRDERVLRAAEQGEEAPVGSVGVQAHAVALAQGERLVDAIHRPHAGRPGRQHDRPHVSAAALGLDGIEVDAPLGRRGHGGGLHAEDPHMRPCV